MNTKKISRELFFSKTNDFLNLYLPCQAIRSNNTISTYQDGLTVFRRYVTNTKKVSIRKFKFSDCTHDFLLDYISFLKSRGCAESTCNNRLAAVRAYLWYVADGDVSMQSLALGASKVPFLREPKKTKEIINEVDFAALLSAPVNTTKHGIRDQTLMILLYDSAIRVNELLELKVNSLNFEATIPYIRVHGKGDKERIVAITDKTVSHLKKYLRLFHEKKRTRTTTVLYGYKRCPCSNVNRKCGKTAK